MPWNHRVVKEKDTTEFGETFSSYSMSEVFYRDDKPWAYAPKVHAESLEGLREQLQRMLLALDKPALNEVDFDPELQKEIFMQDIIRKEGKPVVNFAGDAEVNFLSWSTIYEVFNHPLLGSVPCVTTSKTLGVKADAEGEVYEIETFNTIYRKVRNV